MPHAEIEIETADGFADTRFYTPPGEGPWPAVILYMDGLGIRQALLDSAERLASHGYAVLLPNLYYRFGQAAADGTPIERDRMMAMVQSVTNAKIIEDTKAFLDFLDRQPTVRGPLIGAVGYCMGGPLVLTVAAAYPERVAAGASIHGARLASHAPDSPHLRAADMAGEIYVAVAEIDPWLVPGETERLDAALKAAGTNHTMEIYPGVEHGFANPGGALYDREASERHWDRILALFERNLAPS